MKRRWRKVRRRKRGREVNRRKRRRKMNRRKMKRKRRRKIMRKMKTKLNASNYRITKKSEFLRSGSEMNRP